MKIIKWFTDTETTGFLEKLDQIITFSVVLEKDEGETIESYEKKILLKSHVMPSAGALLVNNINPFSKEWQKDAIHEREAYLHLKQIFESYTAQGYKILMIAYNLEFDRSKYDDLFRRQGDKLSNYIKFVWDPLPTAKKLIEQGIIVTKEIQAGFNRTYKTSKLEEVYKALGYDSSNIKAHSALDDTKMLQVTAHGLYFLATGRKLENIASDPSQYKTGQTVEVIVDEEAKGLSKRVLKILFNDLTNQKLLVLDEEMSRAQSPESSVRFMSYDLIIDEAKAEEGVHKKLEAYYQNNLQVITEVTTALLNKKEPKRGLEIDFNAVIVLADKILSSPSIKECVSKLSLEEAALLEDAEAYALARDGRSWSREVYGPNFMIRLRELTLHSSLKLILDPLGLYVLIKDGAELLRTEKKTEVQERLQTELNLAKDDPTLKDIIKTIPSTKEFKNLKHPAELLEEFDNKKADVFQGSNKLHKEILTDLLAYYKKCCPEGFKEVSIPTFKLDLSTLLKKKPN